MKTRTPLYLKMLLWLLLNLALIVGMFAVLPGRGGLSWQMLLSDPVRDRLFRIGESVGTALSQQAADDWAKVLAQYQTQYGVHFECCKELGGGPPHGPGGPTDHAPPGAPPADQGIDHMPPPPDDHDGPHGPPPQMDGAFQGPAPGGMKPTDRIWLRHDAFGAYVLGIPVRIGNSGKATHPAEMTVRSDSLWHLLSFLGIRNWLAFPALALLLSLLLWWPLLWHITRSVSQLTRATQRIALGQFDVRVDARSRDELGTLAESVNHMAVQLQNHADAQKRFMADVAHEVTSPLARMQIGLGILEARVGNDLHAILGDLQDDAQQMSDLLRELLLFSRADAEARQASLERVDLREMLSGVIRREDSAGRVTLQMDEPLSVIAHPAMLARAVSNLVRNALRYAGEAGPIEVLVSHTDHHAEIAVRDNGPGVPPEALSRLGEPFYRPELSRSRESGGFGLGLAIVRRCVAVCEGSVEFSNRAAGGFQATIRLASAKSL